MILSEELLYYVWANKTFDQNNLTTTQGEKIEIISYGNRNHSSGPDFINGRIKINDILWVGNIEMHVLSSDWQRHKHDDDEAYNNVILHVVYEDDKAVRDIPTIALKDLIHNDILVKYDNLMESVDWVPCAKIIHHTDLNKFSLWSNTIAVERIAEKTEKLQNMDAYKNKDWHQLMYQYIARYFGASQNLDVFEDLASRLPYTFILKNKHNSFILESFVLGVSGMLDKEIDDPYFVSLKKEYEFQKSKYSLISQKAVEWRNFGMFAAGSPSYRLAQFAAFIYHTSNIFDQCIHAENVKVIKNLLNCEIGEYWKNHYSFGKQTEAIKSSSLSEDMKDRIIINAIVPVLFIYAKDTDNHELAEKSIDFLDQLKSENNAILTNWKALGIKSKTALQSQALIQLKNRYCDVKACLRCPIGRELMVR